MTVSSTTRLAAAAVLVLVACTDRTAAPESDVELDADPAVETGAAVLVRNGFDVVAGMRVGLIANHTAHVGKDHLADLLVAAPNVELVALFGPEHGIRGDADAGQVVGDSVDATTGVPVYSLYGENRSPTPEMLAGVDALVFDIQDIGARFYTYISTMGRAMQSAAENGIPFFVLDRPNPLSGDYVSGFVLEQQFRSFVGEYPIPVAHGMTVGELARMIQGEGMLEGLDSLRLEVVEMQGWRRAMQWTDTGLEWVAPSPNIPGFETALVYPGACFVEATVASEGRGTLAPFLSVGAPWGAPLADDLNGRGLPGVTFENIRFTPRSIPGMATEPKLLGETLEGVRYIVTDRHAFRPVETGIHLLDALLRAYENTGGERNELFREKSLLRLAGTRRLGDLLVRAEDPAVIIASWQEEVKAFRDLRAPYLIYP